MRPAGQGLARGFRLGWLALLLVLAASLSARAAAPPLAVGPGFVSASLAGHLAVLRDPGRRLTLDEVAFGPAGRAFAPLPGPLNLGRIEDAVWLRFSLAAGPGAPARVYLDLQPTILDRLTVYVPTGPGPGSAADFTAVQLGDHVPVVDRASTALAWIVPVDLASVPAPTIYLRIETTSIMVLRSDVRSDDGLIAAVGLNTALSSVFQGITLTMAAVSLVVGLWAGERLFLAYGLYLVLAAATYLFLNGFAQLVLPLMGGNLIDRLTKALVAVQPLAVGWLFWNLVEAGRRPLPWRIAFAAVMLIGAVGTVLTLAGWLQRSSGIFAAVGLGACLLALVCSVGEIRRRAPGSVLSAIGLAVLSGSVLVVLARNVGLLPSLFWTDNAYQLGILAHMLPMAAGLGQRLKMAEAGRREAQAAALLAAQRTERRASELAALATRDMREATQRAEAALAAERAAQIEQVRLIEVIAHQTRTPLATIMLDLQALARDADGGPEPTLRRLGRIRRALDQLVKVIEGNLDRSRLDGASAAYAPRPVDPRPVIEAAVEQARDGCGGHRLLVRFEAMDGIDQVVVDPQLLKLALVNLIENAAKFSAPTAAVEIVCGGRADGLEIAVLDRGIGVPAEDLPRLKEKYFRGANAAGIPGMGMGLPFVDAIARAHGAALRLEPRAGGGMKATLRFPSAPGRRTRSDVGTPGGPATAPVALALPAAPGGARGRDGSVQPDRATLPYGGQDLGANPRR